MFCCYNIMVHLYAYMKCNEQRGNILLEHMEQSGKETFRICSSRLTVEVARPGSAIQKGARFDLTGHVVQVTLDGRHMFCAPEDYDDNRGSGGLGLCNEFYDFSETLYNSARKGEQFPKMGVGLLMRENDGGNCNFMVHFEKEIYPIEVTAGKDTAMFAVQPVECRGYAARLGKKLSVESSTLLIEYEFQNTGAKPIELMEYNHNFVCIDDHPIGPDYLLRLPYPVEMPETPGILAVRGNEITWKGIPDESFYCKPVVPVGIKPHAWELVHKPSGVGMREIDDFPVDHIALWGKRYVVSPEIFIRPRLQPGETLQWRRRYEFFTDSHMR